MQGWLKNLRAALISSALFALISLAWSLTGFFSPFPSKFGEYSSTTILTEVAGHVSFGLVVGVFSFDPVLALTCGAASILVDLDHLLPALGFPALARTTHSVAFTVVAALAVAYLRRSSKGKVMLFVVLVASVLAHMSYDIFAGDGVFPTLVPVTFTLYQFPYWSWLPFESGAATLVLFAALAKNRIARSGTPQGP